MQRVTASTDKHTEIYPGIILSNYGTHFKSSVQPFIYNPYERKLRTYQRVSYGLKYFIDHMRIG